jgi:hypothetical protein
MPHLHHISWSLHAHDDDDDARTPRTHTTDDNTPRHFTYTAHGAARMLVPPVPLHHPATPAHLLSRILNTR